MRALILLSVLTLLQAGCSNSTAPDLSGRPALRASDASDIVFRAERGEYRRGETAKIVLRNQTDAPIGYNLCSSSRELRSGGEWRRYSPLRMCTAAFYDLAPGAETTLEEPITDEWQPGEYRMVTMINLPAKNTHGELFTPAFTVKP